MSSPLAFDKQGNPFSFHKRTRQLRVRLFRNPSARGTCSHVLDENGNPLYIDADTEYAVFRELVGNIPGLYRLDQCDDDGAEVDDTPAYITVDPPRNAQAFDASNDGVSALAVIREMAAVTREMAAIQGQALKALADNHAMILASAAEVMRAPRPAPMPAELRNATDADKQDADEEPEHDVTAEYEDDEEEEQEPKGMLGLLTHLAKMVDPKDAREFGTWLFSKLAEFRRAKAPAEQPAAAIVTVVPAEVATAPTPSAAAPTVVEVEPAPSAPIAAAVIVPEVRAPEATATASEGPDTLVEASEPDGTSPFPALTETQLVHLMMINAQLTADEQAIAEQVMRHMDVATMQRWLGELSAMSVDEATATVRQAVTERNRAISERKQSHTKNPR